MEELAAMPSNGQIAIAPNDNARKAVKFHAVLSFCLTDCIVVRFVRVANSAGSADGNHLNNTGSNQRNDYLGCNATQQKSAVAAGSIGARRSLQGSFVNPSRIAVRASRGIEAAKGEDAALVFGKGGDANRAYAAQAPSPCCRQIRRHVESRGTRPLLRH